MKTLAALLSVGLLLAPLPSAAQDDLSNEAQLERRLRTCLTTGAPGAPRDSLVSAVTALRSLCYTQIRRVREFRLHEIEERFGLPETVLSVDEREEYDRTRQLETRRLNDEIAATIATFTGLTS